MIASASSRILELGARLWKVCRLLAQKDRVCEHNLAFQVDKGYRRARVDRLTFILYRGSRKARSKAGLYTRYSKFPRIPIPSKDASPG
jgi:hypothetical protein